MTTNSPNSRELRHLRPLNLSRTHHTRSEIGQFHIRHMKPLSFRLFKPHLHLLLHRIHRHCNRCNLHHRLRLIASLVARSRPQSLSRHIRRAPIALSSLLPRSVFALRTQSQPIQSLGPLRLAAIRSSPLLLPRFLPRLSPNCTPLSHLSFPPKTTFTASAKAPSNYNLTRPFTRKPSQLPTAPLALPAPFPSFNAPNV